MARDDVFDIQKYQQMTKAEMSDSKFIETLIEKQSFSVLIEEVFQFVIEPEQFEAAEPDVTAQDQLLINQVKIFHKSIPTLVDKNAEHHQGTGFVKFHAQSFKRLRAIQNKEIDSIYKTYKQSVPFQFQYIIDEYMRQICIKAGHLSAEEQSR